MSNRLIKREDYLAFGVPDFTEDEIEAVSRVMRSGWVGMGQETILFEKELSEYIGAPEVVTVNSCTSALFLSLLVEGVTVGDEVIVPSLTWCATANAAVYLGAKPVFCDVDARTMCVTAETILEKVTEKTKAVIVVHYGGYAVDLKKIRKVLPKNIVIIEDAAHALGAKFDDGSKVGTSGNLTCYSFYANKNLSTADGGAIALFDEEKAEHLRTLRMSGMSSHAWARYTQGVSANSSRLVELGYKMNFTDLQASIGRVQLKRLDKMNQHRTAIVRYYLQRFKDAGLAVLFQAKCDHDYHAKHLFVGVFDAQLMASSRDKLFFKMKENNIGVSIHYYPLHLEPFYFEESREPLSMTEFLAKNIMTLPISARVSYKDVDDVVNTLVNLIRIK